MPDASKSTTTPAPVLDLHNIEVVIVIDTSGTMRKKDIPNSKLTRLEAVWENASALAADLEQYDDDGITIVRFASTVDLYDGVTSAKIEDIQAEFRPMGNTVTAEALKKVIDKFLEKRAQRGDKKPLCIIVFTDGVPDDPKALASLIVDTTTRIKDRSEIGILFVQVGEDPEATDYLAKLNNQLTDVGAKHDIVAVTKLTKLEKISTPELVRMAFTE